LSVFTEAWSGSSSPPRWPARWVASTTAACGATTRSCGTPTASASRCPAARRDALAEYMRRDKKARDGYAFVLDGPRGVELVRDVPEGAVRAAFDALGVG